MEVPQGNSLCRYFKQAKMSFIVSFFCKTKEEVGGTAWGLLIPVGRGRRWGKGIKE
jgi:hypothetical protein